jgi:hypothetical protein
MKPQIKELDLATGEEIVRDATNNEIAQIEKDAAESAKIKTDKEAREVEREAILARLGLTADELQTILG